MADALDIGTLSGRIELEDRFSNILDQVGGAIGKFESGWAHAGQSVLDNAASFFTAEAALKAVEKALELGVDAIAGLTVGGAKVADVAENFNHLNEQAGRVGATLMGVLHEGTHNTVTDLELMKSVNADMAAGMKLSNEQYGILTKGAFALAQATGGTVTEALDKMSQAMLTGRTRGVAMLTGKIDLAAAEQDYAKKLDTTVDHLTAEGKLEAAREAILNKVAGATKRLGEQTDGLDEIVEQAQVRWTNFMEELGKSVATSPVILAGFNGIRDAIGGAFGGKQEDMVKNITHAIEDGSIAVLSYAKYVVDAIGIAGMEWNAFRVVLTDVEQGWRAIDYAVGEVFLGMMKIANFTSAGHLFGDEIKSTEKYLEGVYNKMAEGEQSIRGYKQAEDDWAVTTGHINDALDKVRERMEKARAATEAAVPGTKEHTAATAAQAKAAGELASAEERSASVMQQTAEERKKQVEAQKELAALGKDYHETLKSLDADTVTAIKHYMDAGVSQDKLAAAYSLTASQVAAVAKSLKEETDAMKLEQKQVNDSKARWAEYNDLVASISGSATQRTIADIEKWEAAQVKAHKDAKTDTADFYDWLSKTESAMYAKSDEQRLTADTHSKAYFEKIARDAQDAYDFARAHADQFTQGYIDDLGKTAKSATETAAHWRESLGGALDDVSNKVRTLSGEMISLQEKADRLARGNSEDVTSQNFEQKIQSLITSGGWNPSGMGSNIDMNEATRLAKLGYSFQEIKDIFDRKKTGSTGPIPPPHGPRIPGFKDGGYGDFGEGTLAMLHGKEMITPLDKAGGMGEITIINHINGTAADVARQVARELMSTLKQFKQFGTAS